jgi:hypothetical protein
MKKGWAQSSFQRSFPMQASQSVHESPRDAIAGLSQSLEKTFDQNRVLWSEMARFTKNESLRFVQLQLDHAHHAFARLDDRRDLSGLLGAQQEWLKEMMQDYAAQSLRYAEMLRTLAAKTRDKAEQTGTDLGTEARQEMENLAQDVEKKARQARHAAE